MIEGEMMETLDLATMSAIEPGKGRFTELLIFIERINPYNYLYVENVMTERFQKFFERNGFVQYCDSMSDIPVKCYYKKRPIAGLDSR